MPEDRRKMATRAEPVAGDNQHSLTVRPRGPVLLNKFRFAKNGQFRPRAHLSRKGGWVQDFIFFRVNLPVSDTSSG